MVQAPDISDFTKEEIRECLNEIRHPFDVAVYGCKNYFNFGAIVRIAHNFLARDLFAIELTKYYKKASMCGNKYENVHKQTLVEFTKMATGRSVVSFERRPPELVSEPLNTIVWPENPIIVFGSEDTGVPDEILEISDSIVTIPVYGVLNDHNVAVAAGIAMYDWTSKHYAND
jgi:tRNA G18 (ribose-2'-O)-methylase SpoU